MPGARILGPAAAALALLAACGGGGGAAHDHASQATCEPAGTELSVAARNLEFDTECLAVPAGQAFTVKLDNREAVTHDFVIMTGGGDGERLAGTDLFVGPKVETLEAGPLEAGRYVFHCSVHPNMVGAFLVK